MALILGTNCGFVTVAPTDDPAGINFICDGLASCFRDVAPTGAIKVTEIGWWCDTASEEANFEVGLYSHNSGTDLPNNLLAGASQTNAKGTTAGWKKATGLDITITAGTTYWLAFQLDDIATATSTNSTIGNKEDAVNAETFPNPWVNDENEQDIILSIYAVYETEVAGTNMQINIGDAWKEVSAMKINIGDVWKDAAGAQINVGDVWKTIF